MGGRATRSQGILATFVLRVKAKFKFIQIVIPDMAMAMVNSSGNGRLIRDLLRVLLHSQQGASAHITVTVKTRYREIRNSAAG